MAVARSSEIVCAACGESVDASNVAIDLTTEVVCAHRSSSEENSSNA